MIRPVLLFLMLFSCLSGDGRAEGKYLQHDIFACDFSNLVSDSEEWSVLGFVRAINMKNESGVVEFTAARTLITDEAKSYSGERVRFRLNLLLPLINFVPCGGKGEAVKRLAAWEENMAIGISPFRQPFPSCCGFLHFRHCFCMIKADFWRYGDGSRWRFAKVFQSKINRNLHFSFSDFDGAANFVRHRYPSSLFIVERFPGNRDLFSGGRGRFLCLGEHPFGVFSSFGRVVERTPNQIHASGSEDGRYSSCEKHKFCPVGHILLGFQILYLVLGGILGLGGSLLYYKIADRAFDLIEGGSKLFGGILFFLNAVLGPVAIGALLYFGYGLAFENGWRSFLS